MPSSATSDANNLLNKDPGNDVKLSGESPLRNEDCKRARVFLNNGLFHLFPNLLFAVLYRQWVASPIQPVKNPTWYIQVSSVARASYVSRAILWEPRDIAGLTAEQIRLGEPGTLQLDQVISCTYVYRTRKELGGTTPKFECRDGNGETHRIKYGAKVHTTVAASRLLWALGFGAPVSTPVKVLCDGCSSDPWNKLRPIHGKSTFDEAVIQEPKRGKEITISGEEEVGWSWAQDLPLVSEQKGGASRAQIDALKLIAVLVQHGDSKSAQQKLICRPQDYDSGNDFCRQPYMYIYDLGKTFGSGGLKVHPLNYEKWKHESIFKDRTKCIGNLRQNVGNGREGLMFPEISERGRLFTANLLKAFIADRSRITAMFAVAHFDAVQPKHPVDDWTDVFISKAREIIEHTPCPN